jgi:glycosyltransferase involved in cell wall biosynthesis
MLPIAKGVACLILPYNEEGLVSQAAISDLFCFSHLRWDFVYQRPQHLMSRAAQQYRVFFIEEPVSSPTLHIEVRQVLENLYVVVPHLPIGLNQIHRANVMRTYLLELIQTYKIQEYGFWYYSPMFLSWATHLTPRLVVYDCMDELSLFAHAPTNLSEYEFALFSMADVVFTGGISLYERKRDRHPNVHCFPSSIDQSHFQQARFALADPPDQSFLPRPRLGYAGVLDERLDLELLATVAGERPEWQMVMLGPTVKIQPSQLPKRSNIHYLGMKHYSDLPAYMANWDVGMLPFALNEATRFISPTKTPEYLAAGLPVVSTPIRDVVSTYGKDNLVQIWDDPTDVVVAVERALRQAKDSRWRKQVDECLEPLSWDRTWASMNQQLNAVSTKPNNRVLPESRE